MREKNSYKFSNLADPRMQEALFCIFERPCIRVRNLALLCKIPKTSLHRKLANLEYLEILHTGGVLIKGMVLDAEFFSLLERDSYFQILHACRVPMTIEKLCMLTGRTRNSLHGTLKKLSRFGLIKEEGEFLTNPRLKQKYKQLMKQLPASITVIDKILEKENIKHKIIYDKDEILVECFGRRRKLTPYARLQQLLGL